MKIKRACRLIMKISLQKIIVFATLSGVSAYGANIADVLEDPAGVPSSRASTQTPAAAKTTANTVKEVECGCFSGTGNWCGWIRNIFSTQNLKKAEGDLEQILVVVKTDEQFVVAILKDVDEGIKVVEPIVAALDPAAGVILNVIDVGVEAGITDLGKIANATSSVAAIVGVSNAEKDLATVVATHTGAGKIHDGSLEAQTVIATAASILGKASNAATVSAA